MLNHDRSTNEMARSLCLNCSSGAECGHSPKETVWFCEEHHVEPPRASAPSEDTTQDTQKPERRTYPGLCSNCANIATCSHPDLQTGVWHCENYE